MNIKELLIDLNVKLTCQFHKGRVGRIIDIKDTNFPFFIEFYTNQGESIKAGFKVDEFEIIDETDYLMASQANKRRLLESIEQIKCGNTTPRQLIEE